MVEESAAEWPVRNLAGFVVSVALLKMTAWEGLKAAVRAAVGKAEEATPRDIENLLWGCSMANVNVLVSSYDFLNVWLV